MKTKILTSLITATLFTGAFAPCVMAEDKALTPIESAAADGRFIESTAQGNWAEIKASELAKSRTKRENVKDFATAMVNDHKEMDKQLTALADKLNVKLPKDITGEQQTTFDLLKNANDADFDRMYMDTMVVDHRKLVALFDDTAKSTKHGDMKKFIDANLPHLQGHLAKAEELAKSLGSVAVK